MKIRLKSVVTCLIAALFALSLHAQTAGYYNVKTFGAKGDGITIDSDAINKAIEAASAAGGGTVYFPAGKYMSYSVRLKDNITLFLDRGSVLAAAVPVNGVGFDAAEPNPWNMYQDFGHSHWHNSLIWGDSISNISIIGSGLIDGSATLSSREGPGLGNKAIGLKKCTNVLLRDIKIYAGGHFALLATGVNNMTIDNVMVDTNRDAFDIDCCENTRITNCYINSPNDDGLVLKSSYGLGYAKDCDNILIDNCTVTGYAVGSLLDGTYKRTVQRAPDGDGPTGRIKFGTESNGGFRNITITNCAFETCRGFAIETVDGALVENVTFSNVVMRNIYNSTFFLRIGGRMRGPEGFRKSVMRNINISNVLVYDADPRYSSLITGLPGQYIEDVTLSNIRIMYRGGLSLKDVTEQTPDLVNNFNARRAAEGANVARTDPYAVPEREKDYPEPSVFGILPASGFFIRHVKNITIRDVEIGFLNEDTRPALVLVDVQGADFDNLKVQRAASTPMFVLRDVKNFTVRNSPGIQNAQIPTTASAEIAK